MHFEVIPLFSMELVYFLTFLDTRMVRFLDISSDKKRKLSYIYNLICQKRNSLHFSCFDAAMFIITQDIYFVWRTVYDDLPDRAEQEGIKISPIELSQFVNFVKCNKLQKETFMIGNNQCKFCFTLPFCL